MCIIIEDKGGYSNEEKNYDLVSGSHGAFCFYGLWTMVGSVPAHPPKKSITLYNTHK
jgi:hypothetical protein